MSEELKPCPFCGGKPELEVSEVDLNGSAYKDSFQYSCDSCGVYKGEHEEIDEAIKSWNTRAPQNEWISVSGYEEIPVGIWKVAELKRSGDTEMHIANIASNVSVIGGAFAFDRHKIYAYSSCGTLPSPPKEI